MQEVIDIVWNITQTLWLFTAVLFIVNIAIRHTGGFNDLPVEDQPSWYWKWFGIPFGVVLVGASVSTALVWVLEIWN